MASANLPVDPPQYDNSPIMQQPLRKVYRLPEQSRRKSYILGIMLTIFGSATMILSFLGFAVTARFTILYVTGVNLWTGLFFLLSGVFGILTYKIPINPHLMHNYYAFSFLSFISSFVQIIFSSIAVSQYYDLSLWYIIITFSLGGIGVLLSLAPIILLSHHIYCKGCCYITGEPATYPPQNQAIVQTTSPVVHPAGQGPAIQPPNLPSYGAVQHTTGGAQQPATENSKHTTQHETLPIKVDNSPSDEGGIKVSLS